MLRVTVQLSDFIRMRISVTVHKIQIGALLIAAILENNVQPYYSPLLILFSIGADSACSDCVSFALSCRCFYSNIKQMAQVVHFLDGEK